MRAALAGLGLVLLAASAWVVLRRAGERAPAPAPEPAAPAEEPAAHLHPSEPAGLAPPVEPASAARTAMTPEVDPSPTLSRTDASADLGLRLLDRTGAPLRGISVDVEAVWSGATAAWITRADADARLRLVLPAAHRDLPLRTVFLRGRGDLRDLGARVAVGPATGPDLGDAVLEPLPLLVSGRVVGRDGRSLERAWVELRVLDALGADLATRRESTRPDGGFEVRAWAEGAASIELTARALGVCEERLGVPPGSAGLSIALWRGGRVAGRVLLDDHEQREALSCLLAGSDGEAVRVEFHGSGELVSVPLRPDRYSLRLVLAGHPEPLLALAGLDVADGAVVAPPELAPCDLRGRLREIELDVSGEGGSLLFELLVRYRAAGAGEDGWAEIEQHGLGNVRLVTAAEALDVEVSSSGYRTAWLHGVDADAEVTLELAHPVELRLRSSPYVPAGYRLEAHLWHADGSAVQMSPRSGAFEGGRVRLGVPEAGSYRAVFSLVRDDARVLVVTARPRRDLESLPLTVLDVEGEQSFAVDVDQSRIDKALAELAP